MEMLVCFGSAGCWEQLIRLLAGLLVLLISIQLLWEMCFKYLAPSQWKKLKTKNAVFDRNGGTSENMVDNGVSKSRKKKLKNSVSKNCFYFTGVSQTDSSVQSCALNASTF